MGHESESLYPRHAENQAPITSQSIKISCSKCQGAAEITISSGLKVGQGAAYIIIERLWARHRTLAACDGTPNVSWIGRWLESDA